jgi:hypothetical protein
VVVTAKDITEEDRRRLNGGVVGLIEKGGLDRESLLAQLREQVAATGARTTLNQCRTSSSSQTIAPKGGAPTGGCIYPVGAVFRPRFFFSNRAEGGAPTGVLYLPCGSGLQTAILFQLIAPQGGAPTGVCSYPA